MPTRRIWPWLALAALGMLAAADAPPNLIVNGDLEQPVAAGQLPAGWVTFSAPGKDCKASVVTPGHNSGHCLLIEGNGEYCGVVCGKTPLADDKSFVVAAWVKAEGGGNAHVKVDYTKPDGWLGSTEPFQAAADGQWHEMAIVDDRAAWAGATDVGATAMIGGDGKAWFDDLALVAVPRVVGNLLANGGFENGADGAATGWNIARPEDEKSELIWTADAAHSGLHGLRLKGAKTYLVAVAAAVARDKAKTLTLSGWLRCRQGEARVKFDFLKDEQWVGDQTSDPAPADGQWHQVSVTLDQTKFPDANNLAAAVLSTGPDGDADADELVLK